MTCRSQYFMLLTINKRYRDTDMNIDESWKLDEEHWPDASGIYTTNDGYQFIYEGTDVPVNIPCAVCNKMAWKAEDGVRGRCYINEVLCKKCYTNKLKKCYPIFLHTLDGRSATNARFLLGDKKAEELEHNKIYSAHELSTFWLKTQPNEKKPNKLKCIIG